ncbi:ATP-dependent Clp protease proteolytic subunit 5, chloroplastic isoform B [Glycine soja]|uniref:ATP-dependent Clp protease proteolytic subunit 5, chloroplastic isoform B n=1 Tax=Glycine soja TaxID=3848 RepID=A0A445FRY0_GLYSO|nr:ATP-dependent Clp protease proteolytic subunit 5, chloroplastic isoform B [Glycine soja]
MERWYQGNLFFPNLLCANEESFPSSPEHSGGVKEEVDAGVKLIGTTSHFVIEGLVAVPIIEQMVNKVECSPSV